MTVITFSTCESCLGIVHIFLNEYITIAKLKSEIMTTSIW